jgi:tRNA A37 threonylcarbamoyladenosine dehydratase
MVDFPDYERRFGGVRRLYGDSGLAKLQAAHVCVIGIGGVGSWAVEALARNAIGTITLIDLDNIAESNVNRQIHALEGEFGKAKVTSMADRIRLINPAVKVYEIEDFVTVENVAEMLNRGFDIVVDAIDDAKAKIAIATFCRGHQSPLIITGAAGGRLDPTKIQVDDFANVTGDRLLAKVRNHLRKDYGFPKGHENKTKQARFGIAAVFSNEQVIKPETACETDIVGAGLNCAGYGSSVNVTATFGFVAAQQVIHYILKSIR